MQKGTLFFFCGKMGAGKSTKAQQMVVDKNAVLLSEDEWLASLYPGAITSVEDYIHYANLLKPQIKQLVVSILNTGTDVVMDFPGNTPRQRQWFNTIVAKANTKHELIYINTPDSTCLKNIAQRRKQHPERAKTDTKAMFTQMAKHFVAPKAEEGFSITTIEHR